MLRLFYCRRKVTFIFLDCKQQHLTVSNVIFQADLARPPAPTYKQDLSDLFDYKYCTDVDLVFQGAIFPVHRAILSVRCPYFQVSSFILFFEW